MKASDLIAVTRGATKKWKKQRKAEERSSRARSNRAYMYSNRVNQSDVAAAAIPKAYIKASSNGKYPAKARQIFYAARPEIIERTGRALDSQYFTQNLLPKYMNAHPETATWWVAYDARGTFTEPHTREKVPLGTIEVGNYLKRIEGHHTKGISIQGLSCRFPTLGMMNRCSAILYVEKQGFDELFEAVELAERYDLAIMSAKGQSVVAARRLVDELSGISNIPVLVLHDFDKFGFSIAQTLTSVSLAAELADRVRYEFINDINSIDLGLRLADVKTWGLESESVEFHGTFGPDSLATKEEQAFLRAGQRVELNAFTSENLIAWIEGKLNEHGIKKVVPDDATLEQAYRRAIETQVINSRREEFQEEAQEIAEEAKVPKTLAKMVRAKMKASPALPWDSILAEIVASRIENEQG